MRGARGPLRIPLPSMPGPKTLCGVGTGPEDSSAVLTWILAHFWSLPSGVSPRLEWGHARALSSRAGAAVSRFPFVDQGICGFPWERNKVGNTWISWPEWTEKQKYNNLCSEMPLVVPGLIRLCDEAAPV